MNYSRLDRKRNPPDIIIKDSGGIMDLFDNAIKDVYLITDEEYDLIAENMSDEECNIFIMENLTFTEKRELLRIINKYLQNH